ncbi:2,5-dihydroxypyridine 5,6-dioxygenase [bacterium BMS3Bbin06]|nr:2,5-dihydroxypyridine 5,6-dioxygenase [bacterium BMS3Bbin06]HDO36161.1 peptidase [Nitrospirota bacterium]HDY72287.1 peptidase [Nitrospirota bacterium]
MLTGAVRGIFHTNLGVKRDERVLIFTDKPTERDLLPEEDLNRWARLRDVVMLVLETGRGFTENCTFYSYPSRGGHGTEPPEGLWKAAFGEEIVSRLKQKRLLSALLHKKASPEKIHEAEKIVSSYRKRAVDVVIALSNYSTSHTRFRDFLTRLCGTRYASMPLFDVSMLEGAMDVDWKKLEKRTKAVARLVKRGSVVTIRSPNGTDITLSKRGRKTLADTGNLRKPGSFGNLPAGEVFFAPPEGTAEGRLVLEWAPTRRLSSPVTLVVKNGRVEAIEGREDFVKVLEDKLSERVENGNIAEVGIGTNERATRPDNILESEKILGTVHVALGDNSSFGGVTKTPFHQDFVFFHPTVLLQPDSGEGVLLMKDGEMIEEYN